MRPILFTGAMIGAMSVLAATDAVARSRTCPTASTDITILDRALLASPPEFDCDFKDAGRGDAGGAGPVPAGAQADAALRRKLDYERQCYRHAEMILRDRLLQLQASLSETITAVSHSPDVAPEGSSEWGQYRDKELGLTFDLPAHIFSLDSAKRERPGTLFSSPDGHAQLRVFGFVNKTNDTPRQYLRRTARTDQANYTYVRIASTFFVVSGTRDGVIFYRRCNFSSSAAKRIGCIQLDYPQREKRVWDAAVTRMSRSLRMVALD
jgi:hypothetical protein